MIRQITSLSIFIALLGVVAAQAPAAYDGSLYTCNNATCVRPKCVCPSDSPPLPIAEMPQFVLFTHDDTTGPLAVSLINQTVSGFKNPNGCSVHATLFTMHDYTDCASVQQLYQAGHEIATHTWNHLAMPPGFTGGLGSTALEIQSARDWLIKNCSLPAQDVVGFRSPYLVHNPAYRQQLEAGGFLYDSSINEHWPMPTSPNGQNRLWPYTMDNGIPQNCAWISGDMCTATEKYPGLWEVPIWVLQTDTYPTPAYAMDPCDGTSGACDVFTLIKSNFDLAYSGNRAPVPIYIHSPWLSIPNNMNAVRQFMQYTSNMTDVYFVTMHQLIQWMQNPVPKSQMNDWLGCLPGGNAAGAVGASSAASAPLAAPVPSPTPTAVPASPLPTTLPAQVLNATAGTVIATPPPSPHSSSSVLGTGVALFLSAVAALFMA